MIDIGLPGVTLGERDHVCVFHRGPGERDAFLSAMVGAGLAAGDRCLCIADSADPEGEAGRLDPQRSERPEQLTVLPATAYLTDGRFVPEQVFAQWNSVISGYVTEGYRHMRGTGELSWYLRNHQPGDDPGLLFEYESLCNTLVRRQPATIFCLYDLDLLDSGLLPGVLHHHPSVLANGALFRAPWGGDALLLAEQLLAGVRDPQAIGGVLAGVRRAVADAAGATRLAEALFDGTPPGPEDAAALLALGIDLDAPLRAAVIRPPVPGHDLAAAAIRLVAQRDRETAFVISDADADGAIIERLAGGGQVDGGDRTDPHPTVDGDSRPPAGAGGTGRRSAHPGVGLPGDRHELIRPTVGLGRARTGAGGVARSLAEARRAADFARRLGRPVLRHEELGLFSLLADGGDPRAMADLVDDWLGPLLAHDVARRTQKLLPTLAAYLDAGAAQQATADTLGVHVSTLKYRLGRIEAVTGHDLSSAAIRFQLQVALSAQRTLRDLGDGPIR